MLQQWLPAELLRLPKLTILSLCPNPFLPLENHTRRRQVFAQPVCSLAEIATRQLLADGKWTDPCHEGHAILPCGLKERLGQVSLVNICEQCKKQYASSSVQDFIWQTVKGTHDIAVRYRFCSIQCSNILHAKLMSADNS
ncbi:uncharacterized protein BYT42DRAFT_311185 [Radiomyces spectabilis]|uniref:uncharacterized protein n=1 Tax=Radiomyces spectabilis TaxID=64574 RepID=UPI00221F2AB5|nr:uncharacterized protein BYT42DRAFT_311185 [Radiomyces spectabilis]KAI8381601.1 hypothetical protein BYT42DRAFT_311185 [Radiomyces spectabilis]